MYDFFYFHQLVHLKFFGHATPDLCESLLIFFWLRGRSGSVLQIFWELTNFASRWFHIFVWVIFTHRAKLWLTVALMWHMLLFQFPRIYFTSQLQKITGITPLENWRRLSAAFCRILKKAIVYNWDNVAPLHLFNRLLDGLLEKGWTRESEVEACRAEYQSFVQEQRQLERCSTRSHPDAGSVLSFCSSQVAFRDRHLFVLSLYVIQSYTINRHCIFELLLFFLCDVSGVSVNKSRVPGPTTVDRS